MHNYNIKLMVIDYLDNYKTEHVLKIGGKAQPTFLTCLQSCPLYFYLL